MTISTKPLEAIDLRDIELAGTQIEGRDRRQVGGFDLTPDELPLFLAAVEAIAAYVKGANLRRAA